MAYPLWHISPLTFSQLRVRGRRMSVEGKTSKKCVSSAQEGCNRWRELLQLEGSKLIAEMLGYKMFA